MLGRETRGPIGAEELAATLLKDLVAACDPVEMTVDPSAARRSRQGRRADPASNR